MSADLESRLGKPKRMYCKLLKEDLTIPGVNELYYECLQKFIRNVMADASHSIHDQINLLPSGRRDGAVPNAIILFNTIK